MFQSMRVLEGAFGRVEVIEIQKSLVMHAHPYVHFTLWLKGGFAYAHVGAQTVEISAQSGLGLNSHASHDLQLNDVHQKPWVMNLYLHDAWLDAQFRSTSPTMRLHQANYTVTPAAHQACNGLMHHMSHAVATPAKLVEDDVAGLIKEIIYASLPRDQFMQMPAQRPPLDRRLSQAMVHMQANVDNFSNSLDVAQHSGLSRSRLYELFQVELATSPFVYWNAMRTELARSSLMSDGQSLTALAFDLGFSTPGNFSRFFKDHLGVTPSTYRRVLHAH